MAAPATTRPLLLLSLDGGGIRGLSSILILKELLRQVNRDVPRDQHVQPWQAFDLIGGTSTGGIIAVMLGRLRMSLEECEKAYLQLGEEIFEPKRPKWDGRRLIDFLQANEKFDSAILERSIKAIIQEKTGGENSPLKPAQTTAEHDCKVFVCSVLERNSKPVFLRSYEPSHLADPLSDEFSLWQALRATSAASTFFDAYQHGKNKFVDGGFAYNNPVQRVMIEAGDLWGSHRPVILISIGTGDSMGGSLGGNIKDLTQSMVKLVTQTEQTAEDFYSSHRAMADSDMYFRFNVPGLATIGMQEYNEVEAINAQTITYLTRGKTGAELRTITGKVRGLQSTVNFDSTLHKVEDLPEADKSFVKALFARAGDYEVQRTQLDLPVHGTCSWIFQHPKFADFRKSDEPSLLWMTGNPGCGKSILARFIADELEYIAEDEKIAASAPITCFFFFKDGQDKRTHSTSAVSALLHQLFIARPLLTTTGREEYAAKGSNINLCIDTLWRILCQACSRIPDRQVICIVDALDECSEVSRNQLISLFQSTFSASTPNKKVGQLKLIVTSRPWPEIERQFGTNSSIRLRGENETHAVAHDIDLVVKQRVKDLESQGVLTPETCEVVERMLSKNADGTFLWISLVLESIVSLPSRKPAAVKEMLVGIPRDLTRLYDHALPEPLKNARTEMSRKLLSILLAATRPLTLGDVNICLNLKSSDEHISDIELEPDINHTVKSLGGFFVRVAHSKVSLVHQTAREYLLRDDSIRSGASWKHSIGIFKSNLLLARICVRFLALEDWKHGHRSGQDCVSTFRNLLDEECTFFEYAGCSWYQHVKVCDPILELDSGLRRTIHAICDAADNLTRDGPPRSIITVFR